MDDTAPEQLNLNDPAVRGKIIKQYNKYGEKFTKQEYGVNRMRVHRWKVLKRSTCSLSPSFADRGSKSSLSPRDIKKLETALIHDPYATNSQLANKIQNKVTPQEVGKIIKKSSLGFTWKLEQVDVEEAFSPEVSKEGKEFLKETHNIPYDDRVYVDETFASAGIPRRYGRFPKGKKPWSMRNRKYPRMVIIGAITKQGWLHQGKIYKKQSLTDDDFNSYVKSTLCPKLGPGKVVFWDQYGKFGRAKDPQSRHFSPKARKLIEARGATLKILPRYGKLQDPIEMLFGDTKHNYNKLVGEKMRSLRPSKLSHETKIQLWHEAERRVGPKSFIRAFKERANGKEFVRVEKEKGLA